MKRPARAGARGGAGDVDCSEPARTNTEQRNDKSDESEAALAYLERRRLFWRHFVLLANCYALHRDVRDNLSRDDMLRLRDSQWKRAELALHIKCRS
eukprot:6184398-Pleurochrysis_carterae.AAC.2